MSRQRMVQGMGVVLLGPMMSDETPTHSFRPLAPVCTDFAGRRRRRLDKTRPGAHAAASDPLQHSCPTARETRTTSVEENPNSESVPPAICTEQSAHDRLASANSQRRNGGKL